MPRIYKHKKWHAYTHILIHTPAPLPVCLKFTSIKNGTHTRTLSSTHLFHLLAPEDLVHHQDDLGGPVKQPLVTGFGRVVIHRVLQDGAQLVTHLQNDAVQVLLHL